MALKQLSPALTMTRQTGLGVEKACVLAAFDPGDSMPDRSVQ
jgi:hypothetical protein